MAISDLQIRAWIKAGQPIAKAEGTVGGLTFTLSSKGAASWVLRYRVGGKPRELTLGRYPEITLSTARSMALEARAKIQQGGDPARDKQLAKIERAGDLTIRALVDDYRAKVLPTLAPATQRLREICLSSIVSRLGGILASSLTGGDVVLLLERIGQQSTYVMAEKTLQVLRHVIQHGQAKRVIAADPTAGIKTAAVLGKRPPTRKRVMLTEAQIRELMADTELSEIPALVLKIQLGTGTRVGARWLVPAGSMWMLTLEPGRSRPPKAAMSLSLSRCRLPCFAGSGDCVS